MKFVEVIVFIIYCYRGFYSNAITVQVMGRLNFSPRICRRRISLRSRGCTYLTECQNFTHVFLRKYDGSYDNRFQKLLGSWRIWELSNKIFFLINWNELWACAKYWMNSIGFTTHQKYTRTVRKTALTRNRERRKECEDNLL